MFLGTMYRNHSFNEKTGGFMVRNLKLTFALMVFSLTTVTAQTNIQLGTEYNLSQDPSSTAQYQITLASPGEITVHITNWISTYDWGLDYDRMYIYNDTSGVVNRNQFSSVSDPFLFHMFQTNTGLTFRVGQSGVYKITIHSGQRKSDSWGTTLVQNYKLSVTSVDCNDIYEPNDTRAQATAISIGASVTAFQWRRVNTAQVGGDEDWYKISISSPGELKIHLHSWTPVMDWGKDFDRLYVYNGNGDALGYGISTGSSLSDPYYDHMMYDTLHVTTMNLTHAGTYYLRYHSGEASNTIAYSLNSSFTPVNDIFEPNDDLAAAKLIPASNEWYNAFEWQSRDSSMNIAGDEDYYCFNAASPGSFSFSLTNWIGIYNWGTDYDRMWVYAKDSSVVGADPLSWMMGTSPINFTVPSAGKYYIRLHCGNGCSLSGYSFKLTGDLTGIAEEEKNTPKQFSLFQNYPNPFNPTTTIKYQIASREKVQLKVFNILGSELTMLVNEIQTAGSYEVKFDASKFSSGIYFYRLQAGTYEATKKLILMK
jgi:hypothetical protein